MQKGEKSHYPEREVRSLVGDSERQSDTDCKAKSLEAQQHLFAHYTKKKKQGNLSPQAMHRAPREQRTPEPSERDSSAWEARPTLSRRETTAELIHNLTFHHNSLSIALHPFIQQYAIAIHLPDDHHTHVCVCRTRFVFFCRVSTRSPALNRRSLLKQLCDNMGDVCSKINK